MNIKRITKHNELSMIFDSSRDNENLTLKNFFGKDSKDIIEQFKSINPKNKEDQIQFIIDNKVNGIDFVRVFHFTRMKDIYPELKKRRDLSEYENDFSNSAKESGCLEKIRNYHTDDSYWNGCLVLDQKVYTNNKDFLEMPDVLWRFNYSFKDSYKKNRSPLIYQVDVPINLISFFAGEEILSNFKDVNLDVFYIYCLLKNIPFCGVDNYLLSETDVVYDLSILELEEGL